MKKLCLLLLMLLFIFSSCSSLTSLFVPAVPKDAIMTPDENRNWAIKNYVDSHGIDTDDMYVETRFSGTFSNTATQGSNCSGELLVNDDREVQIFIYEYGNLTASGFGKDDEYNLTIWDSKTDEILVKDSAWLSDDRFIVDKPSKVINALATHENIRMRLHGGKYTTSTYVFSFDASGFASDYVTIAK